MVYTLRGRQLRFAKGCEIAFGCNVGGRFSDQVQELLDGIEKWSGDCHIIETLEFPGMHFSAVVGKIGRRIPLWGVHKKYGGMTPFVQSATPVNTLTVELTGKVQWPTIKRIYPGEYVPPLPDSPLAKFVEGGVEESRKFWNMHGAVLFRTNMMIPETITLHAPEWWSSSATVTRSRSGWQSGKE